MMTILNKVCANNNMPKHLDKSSKFKSITHGLKDIYFNKIKPLEELTSFERFYSPSLTEAEIEAKPTVLLLGQYSTGKTTFITHLLGSNYPGSHIGPEPTTDKFVAVTHGLDERIIPGNAAVVQNDKPFKTLSQFGTLFLSKFQVSCAPLALLKDITFIDSPGVLSGEKQTLGRAYDFVRICEWFAEKADMILLLFDANKLDISDEFKCIITAIKVHDDKIRVVLNKVDMITNQQLMRVYGALMWSLGKVIHTPEVLRVYIGSHWSSTESTHSDNKTLILAEMQDLLQDLYALPRYSAIRKVNDLVKRCRLARIHAYLLATLRNEMPAMFGKSSRQNELLNKMSDVFTRVQKITNLPPGDFPDITKFKNGLSEMDFTKLPKLNQKILDKLQQALNEDLPRLMSEFPPGPVITPPLIINPFEATLPINTTILQVENPQNPPIRSFNGPYHGLSEQDIPWAININDSEKYEKIFNNHISSEQTIDAKMSGHDAKTILQDSKLSNSDLREIWFLSDINRDGAFDMDEFKVAMKLVDIRINGGPIPSILPEPLVISFKNRHEKINQ